MIQRLHHEGHELAVDTISSAKGLETESYEKWAQEMIGMKMILGKFSNVSGEDIIGMRAPYLKPGRNAQYEVCYIFIVKNQYNFLLHINNFFLFNL